MPRVRNLTYVVYRCNCFKKMNKSNITSTLSDREMNTHPQNGRGLLKRGHMAEQGQEFFPLDRRAPWQSPLPFPQTFINSFFPITSSISSSPFQCQLNNPPLETEPTIIFSPCPSIALIWGSVTPISGSCWFPPQLLPKAGSQCNKCQWGPWSPDLMASCTEHQQ